MREFIHKLVRVVRVCVCARQTVYVYVSVSVKVSVSVCMYVRGKYTCKDTDTAG